MQVSVQHLLKMMLAWGGRFTLLQKGFTLLQKRFTPKACCQEQFTEFSWQNAFALLEETSSFLEEARFAMGPGEGDRKGLPSSESI